MSGLHGQLNFYEKGNKALYWGISLGLNISNFRIDRQPHSEANDSILSIEDKSQPGFNLGLIGNWQFNRYFDLRFIPNMTFGEKLIQYNTINGTVDNRIKTTYISLPVHIRYKSEPVNDWRIFVVAGLKYDLNIDPQVRTTSEPNKISLRKSGLSMEYGIGLQYFFPYFIFSPELKYSHSLNSVLDPNQSDLNRSAIRGLYPRTLIFTLNFEG
ncbi:MAG: PorT family protein [Chitinophagales bacterium]|nr:PorT family protein [Chitinophagales bacterium]